MRIKYHRISRRDHADSIIDYRCRRIGGRCNCPDHAKRRHLRKHQSIISCLCNRRKILRARSLIRRKQVFHHLILHMPISGFLMGKLCQLSSRASCCLTYGCYKFLSVRKGKAHQLPLCGDGRFNRRLSRVKKPAVSVRYASIHQAVHPASRRSS